MFGFSELIPMWGFYANVLIYFTYLTVHISEVHVPTPFSSDVPLN